MPLLRAQKDGLAALAGATLAKAVKEHDLIDACMRDEGRNYTIFSVVRSLALELQAAVCPVLLTRVLLIKPADVIFRPPAAKLKNIQAKDYLGKAVRLLLTAC